MAIAWGLLGKCEYGVEKAVGCEDEAGKEVGLGLYEARFDGGGSG